ncbi:spindle assembly checkpoint component Mad1 [Lipomyces arxii]|uniref:spindle assembly checkpoint component Mad1 n=1 Tax=Lipomyces arxii TaxID=56418 RepID=UPI0034CE61CA
MSLPSRIETLGSSIPAVRVSEANLSFTPVKTSSRPITSSDNTNASNATDSLRAQNHVLQYEISNLRDERERDKLRYEKSIRDLEHKLVEESKRSETVETDQKYIFDKYNKVSEELQKLKSEWPAAKESLEKTVRGLTHENDDVKDARDEAEAALRSAESALKRQENEFTVKQKSLSALLQDYQVEVKNLNGLVHQRDLTIHEQKESLELLAAENKTLRLKAEDLTLLDLVQRRLSEELAKSKTLENKLYLITPELNQLREEHKKFKFVSEEKILLEARLKLMEDLRRQVADAELEAATLREQQSRWMSFLETNEYYDSPEEILQILADERSEKLSLLDKNGRLEAELVSLTQGMETDDREIMTIKKEFARLSGELEKTKKLLVRTERQKNLAAKETQFLRDQLKTYDNEETVFLQGNYDNQKTQRIESLEKVLDELKQEVSTLTAELASVERADTSGNTDSNKRKSESFDDERMKEVLRKNRKLQDDYTELKKKEENGLKEVAVLKKRLSAFEKTQEAQSRILELKDNPVSRDQAVKKEMIDALRRENNLLIAQLENRQDSVGTVISQATLDRVKLELKEMQVQVAEKEKRMKRLKDIWSAKSMEFREAVYSLLGYKLDFLPNNKVRATSMFASCDEESFTFDPDAGTMKLSGAMDSIFAQECSNLIKFWVQERREIPCFLSALNLELYDKTTKAAGF